MHLPLLLRLTVLGLALSVASPALAQKGKKEPAAEEVSLDEDKPAGDESGDGEKKEGEEESGDSKEGEGDKSEGDRPVEPEDDRTKTSPVEHAGETYRFVGARYRLILIPAAIMEMFGEGGETTLVHNFGPEFTIRKDAFEYSFALTYAGYFIEEVPFKAPEDPEEAWEVVTSELKIIYLTADFVWSTPISPQVSFTYGGGAGIGFVFGDLFRTQAYLEDGVYKPCPGPPNMMSPPEQQQYCQPEADDDPQHYPGYTEPSWADGGSKPIIFPWIAIQTGIRWKPHRNFVGRLELGVGLGQFFLGIGADYGL